ncbi:MAG: flagellar export chaperone FliS [Thermodesulfobacteriota bacterium]
MNYGRTLERYQKTSIETSNKLDLVIMCYDKAIECFTRAREHYSQKEYEKKGLAVQKGLDIIGQLQCSLDMENGGEIAANLDRLYSYIAHRVIKGDIRSDLGVFDEAVSLLKELKAAWEGIAASEGHSVTQGHASAGHAATAQVAA